MALLKLELYVAVAIEFFAKTAIDGREGGFFVNVFASRPANPVTVDRERYGGLDGVIGERDQVIIGKELEIRRALSRTHLYSSAFVIDHEAGRLVLSGAGWGHGVGLCQIGAAVLANEGKSYPEILQHYYRGTRVSG